MIRGISRRSLITITLSGMITTLMTNNLKGVTNVIDVYNDINIAYMCCRLCFYFINLFNVWR